MDKPLIDPAEVNRLIDEEISRIDARNAPASPAPSAPNGKGRPWLARIVSPFARLFRSRVRHPRQ